MATLDLSGKLCVIVGLGESGRAAAELLLSRGARVIGTDRAPLAKLARGVDRLEIELVLGGHEGVPFRKAGLVVVSPGVPAFAELREAEASGVEVIGEVELAARYLTAPLLAVGGTNGKSTATTLLGHLVEAAGYRAFVGANLGEPACDAPLAQPDVAVFEVSSFQMERVKVFRPKVGVLLNVSEDHLDRYDSFDDYVAAKGNCFIRQEEGDFAIGPVDDPRCLEQLRRGKGTVLTFGAGGDYDLVGSDVIERSSGERFSLSSADLHGRHNLLNAAAAIAAARAAGIEREAILEGLVRFRALPHRMALSGRYKGVTFYDDSKATNVGAAVTALLGLVEEKGVLIAGGRDKMGSYEPLVEAIRAKARAVVLIGEATQVLAQAIGGAVPVDHGTTMQDAVNRAYAMARPGDAVLLSPACSSLDMFKNYAERGDKFTESVKNLAKRLDSVEG